MSKFNVYEAVTSRIVEALEQGTAPWRKPWNDTGLPFNIKTGRVYRGVNVLLLAMTDFGDPRWGTYKAIRDAGGQVRRGEKSTMIVLWKKVTKKGKSDEDEDSTYRLLRFFSVFNAEQADGLPAFARETREHEPLDEAEAIVAGYVGAPGILHGGGRASYSPSKDLVRVPLPEDFHSAEAYYSTLFHELTHSTGHEKRLARLEPALFGSDPYAREELIAEIGAAMLAGIAGIECLDQSAAYLAGWLKPLKDDRKLIVQAARQAQRAADLILGTTFEDEPSDTKEVAMA